MDFYNKLLNAKNPLEVARKTVAPICKDRLDHLIMQCKACNTNFHKIATYGNPNANLMIINDMSLDSEYINDYFLQMLKDAGIDTNDIFIVSAISCILKRADGSNRLPREFEMHNCKHFLRYAIKFVEPRLILSMGQTSFEMFKEKGTFEEMRKGDNYIYDIKTLVTYSMRNSIKALRYDTEKECNRILDDIYTKLHEAKHYLNDIKGD